jgi:L-amino acid N-acyltransferase YncA
MKIRIIEPGDVPVLAKYECEISLISFQEEAITDLEFHQQKILKAIPKEREGMLVLDNGGEICGWLWMALKTNSLTNEKYVNFKSFYIKEAYRGSEYVDQLLEKGIHDCRKMGANSIVGKVHAKNLPMRILYKNHGFEPTHLTMELKF